MFTEKTEALITFLRKNKHSGKKMLVIVPNKDTREERNIITRIKKDWELCNYSKISIHKIDTFQELINLTRDKMPDILAIDELHLFNDETYPFNNWLVNAVKELLDINDSTDFVVIIAGLDMDYLNKPYEITMQLMGMATDVKKETTTCFKCKKEQATMTYKKPEAVQQNAKREDVGGREKYEARCRACHKLPN